MNTATHTTTAHKTTQHPVSTETIPLAAFVEQAHTALRAETTRRRFLMLSCGIHQFAHMKVYLLDGRAYDEAMREIFDMMVEVGKMSADEIDELYTLMHARNQAAGLDFPYLTA